ncbi:hypothetical protein PVT67_16615 [Gallaecimonas kandeliae]|uniref:hypothetical protein n=1 Tax=Gallaecimonas kandeliae TaxID=3029055 RepID=UPI0026498417|nr:hypothetical protein [Gallaecimonas kandeliae]WKE65266.1 hypothetical protein PVT67_16615 [Gallaecimonas kandeliae]
MSEREKSVGQYLGTIMAYSALMGDSQTPGQLLVPYLILEDGSVHFFEGEDQADAVAKAEAKIAALKRGI